MASDPTDQTAADGVGTTEAPGQPGAPPAVLDGDTREPLPRAAASDRLLWMGGAVAALAHLLPLLFLGNPEPLGEGVLTEAIAVELIDAATLEGRDQTPPAPASSGAPPPQTTAPAPPGQPQKAAPAVPPSPPPTSAAVEPSPAPDTKDTARPPPAPRLPAFAGDGDAPQAVKKPAQEPREPVAAKPVEPEGRSKSEAKDAPEKKMPAKEPMDAKPRPPQPQRPPPQPATPPRAPPASEAAKSAPPRNASAPAQARSGEVTQFAKEVVAALAKAKPASRGIKGRVTVTVVVAFGGGVRVAKVTGSSGRADLDALALQAAKQAKLPAPPPDVLTDDLFYDVEYKFE